MTAKRINIISNNRGQTGLTHDTSLFRGIWSLVDEDVEFRRIHHSHPQCPEADINVFFEVLNPSLFVYAGVNIWIPNPEWTYTTWIPYLSQLDFIWCKTHHAVDIFRPHNQNTIYIGWSSIGKAEAPIKYYNKAIVLCGKNVFRHPQILVDAYRITEDITKLPELHIVCDSSRMNVRVYPEVESKIKMYTEELPAEQYDELLSTCGLAICISSAEGFGHAVNEAASSGCNLILSDILPFREFGYDATWVPTHNPIVSDRVDTLYNYKISDVFVALDTYLGSTDRERIAASNKNADAYREKHSRWIETMKQVITTLRDTPSYSLEDTSIPEDQLPGVTIVTPTKDRLKFMEICAGCVDTQCYPRDKLEWLVIDDGKDTCEDIIKHIPFAKHILCMSGHTIAAKRNIGAQMAKYPVIVHFDDDDIYPPNSILFRVSMLMRGGSKGAVFCTTIPCYDLQNYISFVNVPPMHLTMSERVSEATLAYTKQFWEEKGFHEDTRIAEGDTFLRGREDKCREISPQEVIVSLVHSKTTSSRKAPAGMEPNGCHYGFTDELFTMISKIIV